MTTEHDSLLFALSRYAYDVPFNLLFGWTFVQQSLAFKHFGERILNVKTFIYYLDSKDSLVEFEHFFKQLDYH